MINKVSKKRHFQKVFGKKVLDWTIFFFEKKVKKKEGGIENQVG